MRPRLGNMVATAQGSGEGEKTAKTSSDVIKMAFKLKADQADIVQQALAKAKGELHTDFDSVAIENICAGYVGGVTQVAKVPSLDELIEQMGGFEPFLGKIADKFPDFEIVVTPIEEGAS